MKQHNTYVLQNNYFVNYAEYYLNNILKRLKIRNTLAEQYPDKYRELTTRIVVTWLAESYFANVKEVMFSDVTNTESMGYWISRLLLENQVDPESSVSIVPDDNDDNESIISYISDEICIHMDRYSNSRNAIPGYDDSDIIWRIHVISDLFVFEIVGRTIDKKIKDTDEELEKLRFIFDQLIKEDYRTAIRLENMYIESIK